MWGKSLKFSDIKAGKEYRLVRVTHDMLAALQNLLNKVNAADPIVRSSAYHAITGRKGLYLFGDEHTVMIIALHPNIEGRWLFFPPLGRDPAELIKQALTRAEFTHADVQMARVPVHDVKFKRELEKLNAVNYDEEIVLDWNQPIRVVSSQKVIDRKGKEFNNLRSHVNKAFRNQLYTKIIDIRHDAADIMKVAKEWSGTVDKPHFTEKDLTGPAEKALELMKSGELSVSGLIVYNDQKPIGFWIWDEGQKERGIAVSLVRVSIAKNIGAAELAGLRACEILQDRGFTEFCFGGSETEKLDHFKRKFNPVWSIELASVYGLRKLVCGS